MKIISVDFGGAHTGIAISDPTETLARPVKVIHETDLGSVVARTAETVIEQQAGLVVVGNPVNMNGTSGPQSEKCRNFADKLSVKLKKLIKNDIPVELWDERKTTVTANQYMTENKSRDKKQIDAVAAAVILESYLLYRKNKYKA